MIIDAWETLVGAPVLLAPFFVLSSDAHSAK